MSNISGDCKCISGYYNQTLNTSYSCSINRIIGCHNLNYKIVQLKHFVHNAITDIFYSIILIYLKLVKYAVAQLIIVLFAQIAVFVHNAKVSTIWIVL